MTPWVDLSTGINPWPYPNIEIDPEAVLNLALSQNLMGCRIAMAQYLKVAESTLVLAPGSELLIKLLPNIISPKKVAIISPTYGDHQRAWSGTAYDVEELSALPGRMDDYDSIVLCHPNNPDGRLYDIDVLETTRQGLARKGGWLIIDEAYADLYPSLSMTHMAGQDGLIILRSLGKFFGLAGLRLGAILAPPAILGVVSNRLGVWPISGPTLTIATRAYQDQAWQEQTRHRLQKARDTLDEGLRAGGLNIVGGCDLFRFVETQDAVSLWDHLARSGIYTRLFRWSDKHLRIGLPADKQQLQRLSTALQSLSFK